MLVHYATFHMPPEPDGFYRYNSLQHLAYFAVVFLLPPLSILTGLAMSPAVDNRFRWYARLFGGRQGARSIHFLLLLAYLGFIAVHVLMVVLTGLARNMDHIVMGTDETGVPGLVLGGVGIAVIVLACLAAHWVSWHRPRALQYACARLVEGLMRVALDPMAPRAQYSREEISPHFWPNGKLPTSDGVAAPGRRRLPRLPPEGPRAGAEPGRALDGRDPGAGQAGTDHDAPLHPGLVGDRRSGAACRSRSSSSWSGRRPRPGSSCSTPSARASTAASTTTATA